ncbi:MAG: UDP-N-acetylmuramate--alanine ligase [Rhodobacter sp.]|nr:UDP-N-acetylmuramate--alanine ligase [Rhodobacter sp.]
MIWGFVTPLFFGCLWIVLAAVVAMLPMRRQMVPGLILLIIAPFLLTWIAWFHGWGWAVAGIIGFASMFRNPLIYFARRALGKPAPLPKELEK